MLSCRIVSYWLYPISGNETTIVSYLWQISSLLLQENNGWENIYPRRQESMQDNIKLINVSPARPAITAYC